MQSQDSLPDYSRTFTDCYEALEILGDNYTKGIYYLKEESAPGTGREAYCDEHGWTVIQSRGPYGNPTSYFYKGWKDYVDGFGDPGENVTQSKLFKMHDAAGREHWFGLEQLQLMTSAREYRLRCAACNRFVPDSVFTYGEAVGYRLVIFSFFFFLFFLFLLCQFTILPWDQKFLTLLLCSHD